MENNTEHNSYQSYSISPIHLLHQYTSERVQSVCLLLLLFFFISLGENVGNKSEGLARSYGLDIRPFLITPNGPHADDLSV